jgi:tetratricopeptide (TPR) repeat protein
MSDRLAPSFARQAADLLRGDRAVDAAQLCAEGLKQYPDYAGGYLLLADAYRAMDQPKDAEIILAEARRRFPKLSGVTRRLAPLAAPVPRIPVPEPELPVREPAPASAPAASPLRVINTADLTDDQRIIRSASVRLIPGLEYTTLRFEGMRSRGRREITPLSDPPPFRSFHTMRRTTRPAEQPKEQRRPVSLEELAARLEKARIPTATEVTQPATPPPTMGGPRVVTETIARIYMQQGSFDRAIEALRTLQASKPERHDHFEKLIAECERSRSER